jgi:hypothetical protein
VARLLFVVSRDHHAVYETLRRGFAESSELTIILDRRFAERRRHDIGPPGAERRKWQRRQPPDPKYTGVGWRVVPRPDVPAR